MAMTKSTTSDKPGNTGKACVTEVLTSAPAPSIRGFFSSMRTIAPMISNRRMST